VLPLWDIHGIMKDQWTFIPIDDIPDIEKIQTEFRKMFDSLFRNMFKDDVGHDFGVMDAKKVRLFAPTYINFLKSLGIDDTLKSVAFSGSQGENRMNCPIHIDSKYPDETCPGLNIPITGCEKSWTVFYDIGEHEGREDFSRVTKQYKNSVEWNEEEAVEIARVPATQPTWVNIAVPHKPVTDHTDLRLIITSRFDNRIYNRMPGFFK